MIQHIPSTQIEQVQNHLIEIINFLGIFTIFRFIFENFTYLYLKGGDYSSLVPV